MKFALIILALLAATHVAAYSDARSSAPPWYCEQSKRYCKTSKEECESAMPPMGSWATTKVLTNCQPQKKVAAFFFWDVLEEDAIRVSAMTFKECREARLRYMKEPDQYLGLTPCYAITTHASEWDRLRRGKSSQ